MAFADPPYRESVVVPEEPRVKLPKLIMHKEWLRWLGGLVTAVDQAPVRKIAVRLTNQSASLGATPFPVGALASGLYRISYYVRITTPDGTSSSLAVSLNWTDGGVAITQTGDALVLNATNAVQFRTLVARIDGNTPISYATTYAAGGGAMRYRLDLVLEALGLESV